MFTFCFSVLKLSQVLFGDASVHVPTVVVALTSDLETFFTLIVLSMFLYYPNYYSFIIIIVDSLSLVA